MLSKPHVFLTITLLDPIFKIGEILPFCNIPSATFLLILNVSQSGHASREVRLVFLSFLFRQFPLLFHKVLHPICQNLQIVSNVEHVTISE